jgi:hypothetical protein
MSETILKRIIELQNSLIEILEDNASPSWDISDLQLLDSYKSEISQLKEELLD